MTSDRTRFLALVLAVCGPACAIPPASAPSTPCAQSCDVAIVVVSEPSTEHDATRTTAGGDACASFCAELDATCPGALTGGPACVEACVAWTEPALDCRADWLGNGSCIGATVDSPTC